jgi:hypothetical protein
MPSQDEFVKTLLQFPLVQSLSTCARRLKLRFALRGGVLRNHLWTLASGDQLPDAFYDYVDPFSDVDLVLEQLDDWSPLAQAISESVPYSGFLRWEVIAEDALRVTSKQFGSIAADRLLMWFDGTTGKATEFRIDGLDIDLEQTLQRPSLALRSAVERPILGPPFTHILDMLRLARYSLAFPRVKSDFELPSVLQSMNAFLRVEPLWLKPRVDSFDLRRLEIALLDLLFTAHNWGIASNFAKALMAALPRVWSEAAPIVRALGEGPILGGGGTGIGALLYKEGPQSPLSTQLFADSAVPLPELGGTKNLIPWVRINSYGHNPDSCCNYRDFENGVATVAWRTGSSDRTLSQVRATEVAVVAAVEPLTQTGSAVFRKDPALLPLPGFVHRGQSFTVRVDHGFVRGYLNRNVSFYLGVTPAEIPKAE